MAGRLESIAIFLFQRLEAGEFLASHFHAQFDERITRAGSGRGAQYLDLLLGQAAIDVAPHLVRVGNQLVAALGIGHILGQSQEELLELQLHRLGVFAVRQHDTVIADLDFDDLLHTIAGAGLFLGGLDGSGSVGNVGSFHAHARTKQFETAAGARGLDFRRLELPALAELFRHHGGERIDRRGADDTDVIPRLSRQRRSQHGCRG